jgi:sucrose synthase
LGLPDGHHSPTESLLTLEMDLEPFNAHFPMMTRPSWIGDGVRFLNRHAT